MNNSENTLADLTAKVKKEDISVHNVQEWVAAFKNAAQAADHHIANNAERMEEKKRELKSSMESSAYKEARDSDQVPADAFDALWSVMEQRKLIQQYLEALYQGFYELLLKIAPLATKAGYFETQQVAKELNDDMHKNQTDLLRKQHEGFQEHLKTHQQAASEQLRQLGEQYTQLFADRLDHKLESWRTRLYDEIESLRKEQERNNKLIRDKISNVESEHERPHNGKETNKSYDEEHVPESKPSNSEYSQPAKSENADKTEKKEKSKHKRTGDWRDDPQFDPDKIVGIEDIDKPALEDI